MNGRPIRAISAHLPHTEYSDGEYEATLHFIEDVIHSSRRKGYSNIIGIDANAVVGEQGPYDDHRTIGS